LLARNEQNQEAAAAEQLVSALTHRSWFELLSAGVLPGPGGIVANSSRSDASLSQPLDVGQSHVRQAPKPITPRRERSRSTSNRIGREAARNLDEKTRRQFPSLDFRAIVGMRNVVSHDCRG